MPLTSSTGPSGPSKGALPSSSRALLSASAAAGSASPSYGWYHNAFIQQRVRRTQKSWLEACSIVYKLHQKEYNLGQRVHNALPCFLERLAD